MCTKYWLNRLGGLSLPRKCGGRLTDRPNMALDVYHGRKTTIQQQQQKKPASGKIGCTNCVYPL